MSTFTRPLALIVAVLVAAASLRAATPGSTDVSLPRFTEEREAAALFFLRKHTPALLPFLEQIKKVSLVQYQHEIREVFQVTEMLADLQEDPRRHDLELEIWKTESKAHTLVARLTNLGEEDRRKVEGNLLKLARELVDLDIQVLELKTEQTEKELTEVKEELAKARDQIPVQTKARYEKLLEQVRKRRK